MTTIYDGNGDVDLNEVCASEPDCIRCGRELTPEICGEEFVETGVCVDCWTPDDEDPHAISKSDAGSIFDDN